MTGELERRFLVTVHLDGDDDPETQLENFLAALQRIATDGYVRQIDVRPVA